LKNEILKALEADEDAIIEISEIYDL